MVTKRMQLIKVETRKMPMKKEIYKSVNKILIFNKSNKDIESYF